MTAMRARRLGAVALLLPRAGPLAAEPPGALPGRIEASPDAFRDCYGFPGAIAAIALPDRIVASAAADLVDVEAERTMTPETRMLAASVGKTFVAATVLALESEGRLERADQLTEHLGDRPWFAGLPNAGSITIGHLLHHRPGSGGPSAPARNPGRRGADRFGPPEPTADAEGRLVRGPGVEWTGDGLAVPENLVRRGHALVEAAATEVSSLDRAPNVASVAPDAPDAPHLLCGAGVAIHAETPRGQPDGHGGWRAAHACATTLAAA